MSKGGDCLTISFDRGVCGRCAREKSTQIVADVSQLPYHIACSATTHSEIVVPLLDSSGEVRAVLDIDSDLPNAFDTVDQVALSEPGWARGNDDSSSLRDAPDGSSGDPTAATGPESADPVTGYG